MQETESRITVGRFGGVHGVKGWIKINSYTRPKENIFSYTPWIVKKDSNWQEEKVEETQQRGERLLVKLIGIDTPEQAREFINSDIAISRGQLPALKENEYYWFDLIGLEVFNQDEVRLGEIKEILETGANDVLVIKDKRKYLIPLLIGIYVMRVDLEAGKVSVDWQVEDDVPA